MESQIEWVKPSIFCKLIVSKYKQPDKICDKSSVWCIELANESVILDKKEQDLPISNNPFADISLSCRYFLKGKCKENSRKKKKKNYHI